VKNHHYERRQKQESDAEPADPTYPSHQRHSHHRKEFPRYQRLARPQKNHNHQQSEMVRQYDQVTVFKKMHHCESGQEYAEIGTGKK
jgi:hypothetical protein